MKEYLMGLICAAILCAVLRAVTGEGKDLRKLICGVFLTLTALSLPGELELPEFDLDTIARDAQAMAQDGAEQAQTARETVITESVETYIWNKAAGLGLELTVRVELGADLVPETVTLTGEAPSDRQHRLTQELVRELGLGEEDVIWILPYQSSA